MLTPEQANKLFVPIVALTMSGFMSLVMTAANLGVGDGFAGLWLRQWLLAFIVALPIAYVVVPAIRAGLVIFTDRREPGRISDNEYTPARILE